MGRTFEADRVGRDILRDIAIYSDRGTHEGDCGGGGGLSGSLDDNHIIDYLSPGQLLCDGDFYSVNTFMYCDASVVPVYCGRRSIKKNAVSQLFMARCSIFLFFDGMRCFYGLFIGIIQCLCRLFFAAVCFHTSVYLPQ